MSCSWDSNKCPDQLLTCFYPDPISTWCGLHFQLWRRPWAPGCTQYGVQKSGPVDIRTANLHWYSHKLFFKRFTASLKFLMPCCTTIFSSVNFFSMLIIKILTVSSPQLWNARCLKLLKMVTSTAQTVSWHSTHSAPSRATKTTC